MENNLKNKIIISNTDGIPDWCGIFAIWAIKAAGVGIGTWKIGGILLRIEGIRQIHDKRQVKRGDIGYITKNHHQFLVKEVYPDGTIDTIDGNSGLTSTITVKRRMPISSVHSFYSAFK